MRSRPIIAIRTFTLLPFNYVTSQVRFFGRVASTALQKLNVAGKSKRMTVISNSICCVIPPRTLIKWGRGTFFTSQPSQTTIFSIQAQTTLGVNITFCLRDFFFFVFFFTDDTPGVVYIFNYQFRFIFCVTARVSRLSPRFAHH